MGFRVLEVQPTPNPNAMKFVLDGQISDQPVSFFNRGMVKDTASKNASLANQLFEIEGVASLFWLNDFLTVNKSPQAKWPAINRRVKKILADFTTGEA